MKNPTCPNGQTTYDYFHDLPDLKRSLTAREQCSARNNFRQLVNWMARLLMSAATALNFPDLIELWDDIVAGALDEGLLFESLFRQRQHTDWDPVAFTNDVLLNAQIAGPGIRGIPSRRHTGVRTVPVTQTGAFGWRSRGAYLAPTQRR